MYRLDKTKFRGQTFENASKHSHFYKSLSWKERFRIAIFLNTIAYRLVGTGEPKMDKKVFSVRENSNG